MADTHTAASMCPFECCMEPKIRVITATLLRGYADRRSDFEVETVDDAGHWIVEQQHVFALRPPQAFLAGC